jgi:hypothetical protein
MGIVVPDNPHRVQHSTGMTSADPEAGETTIAVGNASMMGASNLRLKASRSAEGRCAARGQL